eukprot:Polyplicarium_translucidae@DN2938_c0_g1_i1.p1
MREVAAKTVLVGSHAKGCFKLLMRHFKSMIVISARKYTRQSDVSPTVAYSNQTATLVAPSRDTEKLSLVALKLGPLATADTRSPGAARSPDAASTATGPYSPGATSPASSERSRPWSLSVSNSDIKLQERSVPSVQFSMPEATDCQLLPKFSMPAVKVPLDDADELSPMFSMPIVKVGPTPKLRISTIISQQDSLGSAPEADGAGLSRPQLQGPAARKCDDISKTERSASTELSRAKQFGLPTLSETGSAELSPTGTLGRIPELRGVEEFHFPPRSSNEGAGPAERRPATLGSSCQIPQMRGLRTMKTFKQGTSAFSRSVSTFVTDFVDDQPPQDGLDVVQQFVFELSGGRFFAERHFVVTDDDYLLVVHRLRTVSFGSTATFHRLATNAKGSVGGGNVSSQGVPSFKSGRFRKTVLLQHALLECSSNWVAQGPNCLPFQLLKAGHDVWLGNNRGNLFSKRLRQKEPFSPSNDCDLPAFLVEDLRASEQNSQESPASQNGEARFRKSLEFCNCVPCQCLGQDSLLRHILPAALYPFNCKNQREADVYDSQWSWEEMARLDVSATVEYVRNATGKRRLVLGGVSQGGLQSLLYAALSQPPGRRSVAARRNTLDPEEENPPITLGNPNMKLAQFLQTQDSSPIVGSVASTDTSPSTPCSPASQLQFPASENNLHGDQFPRELLLSSPDHGVERLLLFAPCLFVARGMYMPVGIVQRIARVALKQVFRGIYVRRWVVPELILTAIVSFVVGTLSKLLLTPVSFSAKRRIFRITPNGETSVRNMMHFLKQRNTGLPASRYDGPNGKLGPRFPIERIRLLRVPVDVFLGDGDELVDSVATREELRKRLGNLATVHWYHNLSHLDFVWGSDRCRDMYPTVIKTLR